MRVTCIILGLAALCVTDSEAQYAWRIQASGTQGGFKGVGYFNNAFHAVNGDFYSSADGFTWKKNSTPSSGGIQKLVPTSSAMLGFDEFTYYSSTAIRITLEAFDASGAQDSDAAFLKSLTVSGSISLNSGGYGLLVFSGEDLKPKKITNLPWSGRTHWIIATDSEFLAQVSGAIYASLDGVTWSLRSRTQKNKPFHHAGTLLVSGEKSTDGGATWVKRTGTLVPMAFGAGVFVTAGEQGKVRTSPDAEKWTDRETGTTSNIAAITYGNGVFVAVGAGGRIITSQATAPKPPVVAPSLSISPAILLKWPSTAGLYYQPQYSIDLKSWTSFDLPIPGTGVELSRTYQATDARRYFRLVVE